ncbi:MAG: T9SS type A sorting domain-containing protein [Bacteroidota bacterium]|jgi:hypothetical protein
MNINLNHMLKKLLCPLSLLFCFALNTSTDALAQCVPNTSITDPGIYPDSATGLTPAIVNQPYAQDMQLRVPVDTVTTLGGAPITVQITSITLTQFIGLPPGLTYTCTPSNCVYPGGTNGCVLISGTPLVAGNYNPLAITTTLGSFSGFPLTQVDTIDYYFINVSSSATGIYESTGTGFSLEQNMPNPADGPTTFRFMLPHAGEAEFRLINLIGKEVYRTRMDGIQGENSFSIDSRNFSEGVYMYTLEFEGQTLSRRMVISRK